MPSSKLPRRRPSRRFRPVAAITAVAGLLAMAGLQLAGAPAAGAATTTAAARVGSGTGFTVPFSGQSRYAYWTPIPPAVSSAILASEHGQVSYADYRNAFPQGKTTTNPVCRWAVAISAPRLRASAASPRSGLTATARGA